ncbi:MAG: MFS transporter [Bauldia sp.]|nr:MFS transporter [Bauldia sp.]
MSAQTAEIGPRERAFVLGATILASSLAFIDGTVVNVALPTIQEALDTDFSSAQWVLNAYMLMLGALILVAGGLGDRYGRRRIFLIGIALFTAASIVCALAPGVSVLIGARAVQGVGAALLVPQSLAIITATFPRAVRGAAIGTWAAASAATTALGPPIGGFLVDLLDWRAVFWINVPLAALAIFLTIRAVPESRDPAVEGKQDWLGAALAVLGFGALTFGLTGFSNGVENVGAAAYAAIVAGAVAIAAFVFVEMRVAQPVVPPSLFRSRVFTGANIVTVFLYGCLAAVVFLLPYEVITRRGMSTAEAGFTLMPVGIIIAVASRLTGRLSDRIGPRSFLMAGTAIVTLSCIVFALGIANYWIGIIVPVVLLALGMAVVVSPLTTAVMNSAPEGRSGAASGVNNAASRIAGLIAVAAFGALASLIYFASAGDTAERFGVLPEAGDPLRPELELAFDSAYRGAMWFAALWAALALLSVWLFVRNDESTAGAARA